MDIKGLKPWVEEQKQFFSPAIGDYLERIDKALQDKDSNTLESLIKSYFKYIFSSVEILGNKDNFNKLSNFILNPMFSATLLEQLNTMTNFSEVIIGINSVIAQFYLGFTPSDDATVLEPESTDLIDDIAYKINGNLIDLMSAILGRTSATHLAVLRYSSYDENINVDRVIRLLVTVNKITVQEIETLFGYLFKTNFRNIFNAIMFTDAEWFPEEQKEAFDEIVKITMRIADIGFNSQGQKILVDNYLYSKSLHPTTNIILDSNLYPRFCNIYNLTISGGMV